MNIEANGSIEVPTEEGQDFVFAAQGTFGSGTLTLEYSLDGGVTWTPYTDAVGSVALTAAGGRVFTAPSKRTRLTLASATAPAITATIRPI